MVSRLGRRSDKSLRRHSREAPNNPGSGTIEVIDLGGSAGKVLVTGGAGFLGARVINELQSAGFSDIVAPTKSDCDLTEQAQVRSLLRQYDFDMVIHLAAVVGGIGANRDNPGRFFYDNLIMGVMLMEEARLASVRKFVSVGTICSYPKFAPIPFKESSLWDGYPEETNAPYGLAKKMLVVQAQAYRQQYGFNAINLLPVNLYGPGDNFDPATSHVIPSLILKCFDAVESGAGEIVVWGDGSPTREFLFVDDAAAGIVLACLKYDRPEPVNLGSGREISIADLVGLIARLVGFDGRIIWDRDKPNGQPRRLLDVSLARSAFGFQARVDFEEGLKATIDWYREKREQARACAQGKLQVTLGE